jgi:signal transduction histidine kinase
MLSEIADSHKVSIIVQSGDVPEIEADGEVLKQAIFNIAKNGIEAMNEGGKLLMTPEFISDGDRMLIKITDNGSGIQPHDLKKIFHLFYSTRRSGTGIGLPVAKSIIENHNGWIEIDSKLGVGTTFDIYLPRKQEEGDDNGK